MAAVLFPAPQLSLMVLPLMLFHQIQLMVCTVLARPVGPGGGGVGGEVPRSSAVATGSCPCHPDRVNPPKVIATDLDRTLLRTRAAPPSAPAPHWTLPWTAARR